MRRRWSTFFKNKHSGNATALRTLAIGRAERRPAGGTWISGTIEGYRFCALVFAEHAKEPSYEIERSRISKLEIRRVREDRQVFNWDRGLDSPPEDEKVAGIVDHLCAVLADIAYPKLAKELEENV